MDDGRKLKLISGDGEGGGGGEGDRGQPGSGEGGYSQVGNPGTSEGESGGYDKPDDTYIDTCFREEPQEPKRGRGRPRKTELGGSGSDTRTRPVEVRTKAPRPSVKKSKVITEGTRDFLANGILFITGFIADKQPLIPREFDIVPTTALQDVYRLTPEECYQLVDGICELAPYIPVEKIEKYAKYAPLITAGACIGGVVVPRYMAHQNIMKAWYSYEQHIQGQTGFGNQQNSGASTPKPTPFPDGPSPWSSH